MKNNKYIYIALCSLGFIACEPEFDQPLEDTPIAAQTSGEANFSKYISLGNSLTAGFADGSLYRSGQESSFANILATQMQTAGGGEFLTPFMNDDIGGFVENPTAFPPRRVFDAGNRAPVFIDAAPTTSFSNILTGPFNNMGVPGAKSFHLAAPGYGSAANLALGLANPYFVRFASSPNTSVIADALAQQPTFFTLWIGNNDVLSYATAGGIGVLQPTPTTNDLTMIPPPGGDDISDPTYFAGIYTGLTNALASTNAKGVLINVPNVSTIPFFTTVPFNAIPLDQATADAANTGFANYNGGLQLAVQAGVLTPTEATRRTINFTAGQNAVVIIDENLTDLTAINAGLINIRQATPNDLLLLTVSGLLGTPNSDNGTLINGISAPLGDQWILTPEEQLLITNATNAYNQTIQSTVSANPNLALLDANTLVSQLASGGISSENGTVVTSDFATGGAFSLDGIHLTPRGNAFIANELIEVINSNFGSTLQKVDPNEFKTITLQ